MTDPTPDFLPLTHADQERLRRCREWLFAHVAPEGQDEARKVEGRLTLVQTIVSSGWVERDDAFAMEALGVALGDALADWLKMEWAVVEDEDGRDVVLVVPGTTAVLHARGLVVRYWTPGEPFDAFALFDATCTSVEDVMRA